MPAPKLELINAITHYCDWRQWIFEGCDCGKPMNETKTHPENLSDQELTNWVAKKIMGWTHRETDGIWGTPEKDPEKSWDFNVAFINFKPCEDLNHAHLMEEKIREKGLHKMAPGLYTSHLIDILKKDLTKPLFGPDIIDFDIAHASARQRCEAAYLTFYEKTTL